MNIAALNTMLTAPIRARTWKRTLYLLLDVPIGAGALLFTLLVVYCASLSIVLVGVPLLAGCVLVGRAAGSLERARARILLGETIAAPWPWRRPRSPAALLRAALTDRTGWRGIGYLVVLGPWSLLAGALTVGTWLLGVVLAGSPLWYLVGYRLAGLRWTRVGLNVDGTWHYLQSVPQLMGATAIGTVLLLAAPWLVRALCTVDLAMIRGLLGDTPPALRVRQLQASRTEAVDAAAADRRRIERDLHDGAQARMLAVAMDLGMARTKLDTDPAAAAELIAKAHTEAKLAIAELRDIVRGIHPPILADRGLSGALPTLTTRCRLPVELAVTLEHRPSAAVETAAYYSVAELLTNVSKHARATRVRVTADRAGDVLTIAVMDDGVGGADPVHGTGLTGIRQRLRGLDATMSVTSPPGGPTVVRLELPCAS